MSSYKFEEIAKVLEGLPLEMRFAEKGNSKVVSKWLERLGIID
ncbi:hypothetical protein [Desulfosporosinus lacus]|nr:hypothetical protein [Desulfosporosinus lacus]